MRNSINVKYPFFKDNIDLVTQYKTILKNKDIKQLGKWIIMAREFNISYINSFINGIMQRIQLTLERTIFRLINTTLDAICDIHIKKLNL